MSPNPAETPPPGGANSAHRLAPDDTSTDERSADPEHASSTHAGEEDIPPAPPGVLESLVQAIKQLTKSINVQPEVTNTEPQTSGPKLPDVDPYARRLGVGAEIWKTYVEEADKWDKELSDGWNKMLDVILSEWLIWSDMSPPANPEFTVFAALFSAISTAFVLESSKNLRPDPAESSADTLRTITQILLAMSNQSTSTAAALPVGEPTFTPSASAVAVNVLWFMSLILSVAVTLVAMLAKEWCHLFMAGRTGAMHEQARRRQLRLEGVKRWKLEGVIPALPTLMHLALFLFAAGLCVYLWDIHVWVAIPVVVITATAGILYMSAIVLPFMHDFCPYEMALSKLLKPWVRAWARAWFVPMDITPLSENSRMEAPMDDLTSRVLSWLISYCENPKAVDVALQSIAGADRTLPCGPLLECNTAGVIIKRIHDCFGASQLSMDTYITRLGEMSPESYSSVVIYGRSLSVLISHPDIHNQKYHESL